jgi:hypothetical protein
MLSFKEFIKEDDPNPLYKDISKQRQSSNIEDQIPSKFHDAVISGLNWTASKVFPSEYKRAKENMAPKVLAKNIETGGPIQPESGKRRRKKDA